MPPLLKAIIGTSLVLLLSPALLACGYGDDETSPENTGQGGSDQQPSAQLEISAENVSFDRNLLVATPNEQVNLIFHNQDAGVLHNVSVYRSRGAEDVIYVGEMFVGVETRTYRFETPGAGSYLYRCDVHPDTMSGSFVVR
jgi:plastocyanin